MYMTNVSSVGQKMKISHGKEKMVATNLIKEAGVLCFGMIWHFYCLVAAGLGHCKRIHVCELTNSMNQTFCSLCTHRASKGERKRNLK